MIQNKEGLGLGSLYCFTARNFPKIKWVVVPLGLQIINEIRCCWRNACMLRQRFVSRFVWTFLFWFITDRGNWTFANLYSVFDPFIVSWLIRSCDWISISRLFGSLTNEYGAGWSFGHGCRTIGLLRIEDWQITICSGFQRVAFSAGLNQRTGSLSVISINLAEERTNRSRDCIRLRQRFSMGSITDHFNFVDYSRWHGQTGTAFNYAYAAII